MNLSEVRELNDGDVITFEIPFTKFTKGRKYVVKKTSLGKYIIDDNGLGVPLASTFHLENYFVTINKKD